MPIVADFGRPEIGAGGGGGGGTSALRLERRGEVALRLAAVPLPPVVLSARRSAFRFARGTSSAERTVSRRLLEDSEIGRGVSTISIS